MFCGRFFFQHIFIVVGFRAKDLDEFMGEAEGDGSLSTDNHNKIQPTIIQRFPENRTDKRWESMQIQDNTAKFLIIMIIIETVQ